MKRAAGAASDRCPRCAGSFACGAAGPGPCACTTVQLSPALQQQLRQQYSGCLCLACLTLLTEAQTRVSGETSRSPLSTG